MKEAKNAHAEHDKQLHMGRAARLVFEALKDKRIDVDKVADFMTFFDKDFEGAKNTLDEIPKSKSMSEKIEHAELADLKGKTWDELDKENKLTRLRDKFPEVFELKFKTKFGESLKT